MCGGTRLDIIALMLMGCHAYFACGHHLLQIKLFHVLATQTGSFKIKFEKMLYQNIFVIQPSVCCFADDLLSFFNVLRYTAHYITVWQSINLN